MSVGGVGPFGHSIPTSKHLLMVLLGKSGVGKTECVRWLHSSGYSIAVLDTDAGGNTLKDMEGDKRLLWADASTVEKFGAAWQAVTQLPPEWILYIDGFTSMVDLKVESVKGKAIKMTFDQHAQVGGWSIDKMVGLKRREFGRDVIMTCLEEYLQDDDGRLYWGPSISGKMTAKAFSRQFDAILRLKVVTGKDGPQYQMVTEASEEAETKLRVPPSLREKIPGIMPTKDFGKLFHMLKEGK